MLTKITTALVLTFALTAPAFAQAIDGKFRRNTYNQNFRAAQSKQGQPSTGQPSTGQPGMGAPANSVSGSYSARYSGSYANTYRGSYGGTYGAPTSGR